MKQAPKGWETEDIRIFGNRRRIGDESGAEVQTGRDLR